MITIPQQYKDQYALLTGFFIYDHATTPDVLADLYPSPYPIKEITQTLLDRYAVAELIFLQQCIKAHGLDATELWATTFLEKTPSQLAAAMANPAAGQKLFRSIEKESRPYASTKESTAVLDLLKTAFNHNLRVSAVGKVGKVITSNFATSSAVRRDVARFKEAAFWGAFAPWGAEKLVEAHGEAFTPGVRTQEQEQVKKAYVYLAHRLLEAGYSKAETARLLDVERKTIYNWLEATK